MSRSAFYAWLERGEGPTAAEWDEAHLLNEIHDIHRASTKPDEQAPAIADLVGRAFRTACRRPSVTQSASRTGSCLDNVVAESFFATLKVELVHRLHFASRADARRANFAWVHRYNHRRRHSTIGMIPPAVYEQQQWQTRPLPSTVAA